MTAARPRDLARAVVRKLEAQSPDTLRLGTIDLAGALEQALFAGLNRGFLPSSRLAALRSVARIARAVAVSRHMPRRRGTAKVIVVAQQPIHLTLFAPVDAELRRRGVASRTVDVNRAGAAADESLHHTLSLGVVLALTRHALVVHRATRGVRRAQPDEARLYGMARDAVLRLAVDAAHLDSIAARTRAECVVTFNEIGTWSRLGPAVARARGIPSVDLPHAEAANATAIEGLPHDAIGVYGPRSAEVMEQAGVPRERVHLVGPLRHDVLLGGAAAPVAPVDPPRILYASQPERPQDPQLSREAKRAVYGAALAAAGAMAPCSLVIVPHPTEPVDELRALTADLEPPPGVTVVHDGLGLHELLAGSALLVTATSQSVFDAAIVGVPAIMVHPVDGPSRVPYAAEGFAVEVRDANEAGAVAVRMLDPAASEAAVARARRALADRFGVVDGRAHVRAADLIEAAMRRSGGRT